MAKGRRASMSSPREPVSLHLLCSPTHKLSEPNPFGFLQVSLHTLNQSIHWPLPVESISSLSPIPEGLGERLRVPTPLITWLIVLATGPHSSVRSQIYLVSTTRHFYCSHHLKNSRSFNSSVPETGLKTKYRVIVLKIKQQHLNIAFNMTVLYMNV